jgi:predicted MFS family arabinose efflux permease
MVETSLDGSASRHTDDDTNENSSLLSESEQRRRQILKESEASKEDEELTQRRNAIRYCMGFNYMCAMGVCGVVLVALGVVLTTLAANLGMESTDLGSVFLARGVGAITGSIISAKLYAWFKGNMVMAAALGLIATMLIILPFNRNYYMLHVYFCLLGLGTSITDTGCQIQTRRIHGKAAGPWLGANTVAFGVAGALVPLIEVITGNFYVEFAILATLVIATGVGMLFSPDVDAMAALAPKLAKGEGPPVKQKPAHYHVEIVIACMIFLCIGSKVTMTAYIYSFVDDTNMISTSMESSLVLVFWLCIAIGRLAGVYDQAFVTNHTLPWHLFILSTGATIGIALILIFRNQPDALWVGLAFYGLFNGPCVGYCYDMNNRLTYPSEESMAIVMLGLNMGSSLQPYLTAYLWSVTDDPWVLMWMTLGSCALPLTCVFILKRLSYDPTVNPYLKENNPYANLNEDDVQEAN